MAGFEVARQRAMDAPPMPRHHERSAKVPGQETGQATTHETGQPYQLVLADVEPGFINPTNTNVQSASV